MNGTLPALSTKARTLESLRGRLNLAGILPLKWFTVGEWRAQPGAILGEIAETFGGVRLVVRSSALSEDSQIESQAGKYESVLDVCGELELARSIETVVSSYGPSASASDEILVQPMLAGVRMAGVVFSHDPSTGSPYRVVNYSEGADTRVVTGGTGTPKTFVAAIGRRVNVPDMAKVLALVGELESYFPGVALDIEFAYAGDEDSLYVLQVRRLIMRNQPAKDADHGALLARLSSKVASAQQPHPFLCGRSTVFGVMPDWNPAEIVGTRPRPLALSLYRDLVTDAIWAYQRHNYGYRNLRSFPLMVHFAGQPYVDVRLSFNSFIPKDIDKQLADRLVDYYIDRLIAAPALHDKVEFEIVFSCYTLDLPDRLAALSKAGFSERDQARLADSLRVLTNRVIDKDTGLWRADAEKLNVLEARRNELAASGLDTVSRMYWLLEDCKRYGTLPFAGLARAGFIAVQMLKSLVAVGVFTPGDYDRFMNGLNTVSSQLSRDLAVLDRTTFLSRYGHLRPGTYDILSPRYDESPDSYLGAKLDAGATHGNRRPFTLSLEQMRSIARLLGEHGLSSDVVGLFDFLQAGIELREYAKFVFTRNLSDVLSMFREWGSELGFSVDDLSYAHVDCIQELYAGADDPYAVLRRSIEDGKRGHAETCRVWLPPLITQPEDVWSFHVPDSVPNFITQGSVSAPVARATDLDKLTGSIVLIASADPGFDWLFSHPIAGLITAYGGVNSHMAIRANELGLPAVIGAGESLFNRWNQARRLHIDCAGRRVDVLA